MIGAAAILLVLVQALPQPPVFRSGVDLVTVDASVVSQDGRPIQGLTAKDFALEVDGAPRRIVSAHYVPYRTGGVEAAAGAGGASAISTHVTSNEQAAVGRIILLAVDQANIRRTEGQAALRAAAAFVDALDPLDRAAAAGLDDVGPIDFTVDRAAVKRRLRALTGRGDPVATEFTLGLSEALAISDGNRTRLDQAVTRICGDPISRIEDPQRIANTGGLRDPCPVQIEQQSRAFAQHTRTQTTASLNALKRLIMRLGDVEGPKTLVLLSEALVAEPQLVDFSELAALAQRARVAVYVLQLDTPLLEPADNTVSPTWNEDLRLRADGLVRLAGATGGAMFPVIGSGQRPFRRILTELSGYYLLAFEAAPSDRDGRLHRIAVRARRDTAVVRARSAFELAPVAPSVVTVEQRLVQLLRSPRLATELPLRLATYHSRGSVPGQVRTIVAIEAGAELKEVTFGFVVVADHGVIATSATHRSSTGRYSFPAALEAGRYLLRAAAVDAAGRAGSLERPLDVRLHGSAAMRTSDLMLADYADAARTLRPIIDATRANRVEASIEIYASEQWDRSADGVRFELATAADGDPIRTTQATLRRTQAGHWIARANIDLAGLEPGRYAAKAIVPTDSLEPEHVSRSFVLVR